MKIRFFISILFFLFFACQLSANTTNVCAQCKVQSIKKAIELSSEGDTIVVSSGNYSEGNIIVNKTLFIKGEGFPVIDGKGKDEIFSIESNGTIIEGFVLQNSGYSSMDDKAGIKVYSSENVVIRNNKLLNTFFGIYLLGSNNCLLEGNVLKGNMKSELTSGNGIHLWKCDSITILRNDISNHRDGIYFEFVTHSVISENNSHDNLRYGLHFMFSHNDEYFKNIFHQNGAGVAVMYTKGVNMHHNIFSDNWGSSSYGILLKDISDSRIENNIFRENTVAIYMEGTSRILTKQNEFSSNGWALKMLANCNDNITEENNFTGNTFDVSTNGSLSLNIFQHNYWDKYEGYDLNRDNTGDVPYHPVSLYSMVVEQIPYAMMFYRSFMSTLLDRMEKLVPSMTPETLVDNEPRMKKIEP